MTFIVYQIKNWDKRNTYKTWSKFSGKKNRMKKYINNKLHEIKPKIEDCKSHTEGQEEIILVKIKIGHCTAMHS